MLRDDSLKAAMKQAIDPYSLVQHVADRMLQQIAGADGVMIGLADELGVSTCEAAVVNVSHIGTRVGLDSSLSGLAVKTGQVQRSDYCETDPRVDEEACRRNGVVANICIPLTRSSETLGVLAACSSRARAFDQRDVDMLTKVSAYVSGAIGLAHDLARVNGSIMEITSR